jgi:hypothetical protein
MVDHLLSPGRIAFRTSRMALTLTDTCDLWDSATPRLRQATGVPCRVVSRANPVQDPNEARLTIVATWEIRLPAGTDVAPGWQVRTSAATRTASLRDRTFNVQGDVPGSDEVVRTVSAIEVQG